MERILVDVAGTDLRFRKRIMSKADPNPIELFFDNKELQVWTLGPAKKHVGSFNIWEHKETIERGTVEIINVVTIEGLVQIEIGYPGRPEIVLEDQSGNIEGVYTLKRNLLRFMQEMLQHYYYSGSTLNRSVSDMFPTTARGIYVDESKKLVLNASDKAQSPSGSLGRLRPPAGPTHAKAPSPMGSLSKNSNVARRISSTTSMQSNHSSTGSSDEGVFSVDTSPRTSRPNSSEVPQIPRVVRRAATDTHIAQRPFSVAMPGANKLSLGNESNRCSLGPALQDSLRLQGKQDINLSAQMADNLNFPKGKHSSELPPVAPTCLLPKKPPPPPPPLSVVLQAENMLDSPAWLRLDMRKEMSREMLVTMENGDFIIRKSAQSTNQYAIDIHYCGVVTSFHIQVDEAGKFGLASSAANPMTFSSLKALVDYYRKNPISFDYENNTHYVHLKTM